jgi:putative flippase GtrA
LLVGGTNTVIDFAILFILVFLGLPSIVSNFISTSVAMRFSFFANKTFTFNHNDKTTKTQLFKFLLITTSGLWIIQPIIIESVKLVFFNIQIDNYLVLFTGKTLATCITLIWNFVLYRKYVFPKQTSL